ncbi:MAG: hypothetical protein Q8Q37_02145 [bacterium]|nr:hypothetical protein [bacterium]
MGRKLVLIMGLGGVLIIISLIFGGLDYTLSTRVLRPRLSVRLDATSPAFRLVNANSVDNVLAVLKFDASVEDINITQLGLQLSNPGVNAPQDLPRVSLWTSDTNQMVGEVVFTSDYAVATISGFVVPADGRRLMIIKGNIAAIGTAQPANPGDIIFVDYDGGASDASGNITRGVGISSGQTIYATPTGNSYDTRSAGVRIFKAVPTIAKITIPSSTLINGSDRSLYRFSVTAPSTGAVGLYKFSFGVSTTTSGVTTYEVNAFAVYGYSDSSFSQAAYANNGRLNSATEGYAMTTQDDTGVIEIHFDPLTQAGVNEAIQVPAGQTRYFELLGTIANMSATSSTLTVDLRGDAADRILDSRLRAADRVDLLRENDFIWSGNSTTISGVSFRDWANGYAIPGLPSINLSPNTLTP